MYSVSSYIPPSADSTAWKLCCPCRNATRYSVMSPSDSRPRTVAATISA